MLLFTRYNCKTSTRHLILMDNCPCESMTDGHFKVKSTWNMFGSLCNKIKMG